MRIGGENIITCVGAGFYEAVIFAAVFIVLITGSYRLKKLS